ncbi:MAG: sulfite exporter TauE/SafE family protein [Cyanobacteria bacterium J06641_5]
MLLDLLPLILLGFLGSFGHCLGMCGPLAAVFALSSQADRSVWASLRFHTLLNLGRIASYAAIGAAIGSVGSVLVAGIGSEVRQAIAIGTGLLLIWLALTQLKPDFLPKIPLLHPLTERWHKRFSVGLDRLAQRQAWWTPAALGLVWGLIPCGFLYAAQIKALATSSPWQGAATMLAFGSGTLPTMLGIGMATARLSRDRRSQLFRLGSWVTLTIGALLLLRTGNTAVDFTGHGAIALMVLAFLARPLARCWSGLLPYRRALGVGAYILALAHTTHTSAHFFKWNPNSVAFLLPVHQAALALGFVGLLLLTPAALTSFDRAQQVLGSNWRMLHLLGVPALVLAVVHTLLLGSHYFGSSEIDPGDWLRIIALVILVVVTLLLRWPRFWELLNLEDRYVPPTH